VCVCVCVCGKSDRHVVVYVTFKTACRKPRWPQGGACPLRLKTCAYQKPRPSGRIEYRDKRQELTLPIELSTLDLTSPTLATESTSSARRKCRPNSHKTNANKSPQPSSGEKMPRTSQTQMAFPNGKFDASRRTSSNMALLPRRG
jgi:hypothetical protein